MPLKSWSEMMKDSETNVSGFQPLEEGSYDFVIEGPAEVGKTKAGNSKFTIRATVESGPRQNARQVHHFNVSDSAYAMREFFFKPLYAIGITAEFLATEPTEEQIAQAFQGKRFSARAKKQESNGDYMELVDFAPPSGVAPAAGVPSGIPSGVPAGVPGGIPTPQAQQPAPAQAAPVAAAPQAQQPAADASNPWATAAPPKPVF